MDSGTEGGGSGSTGGEAANTNAAMIEAATSNKLRQKTALLPHLAESLSPRVVERGSVAEGGRRRRHPTSENDWEVYLASLLAQDKQEEALTVLRDLECSRRRERTGVGSIRFGDRG